MSVQGPKSIDIPQAPSHDSKFPSQTWSDCTSKGLKVPLWDIENRRPPHAMDYSRHAKAYNDYVQGGHVESDGIFAKRAKDEAAEARRKKQEMDQFDALFGGPPEPARIENARILRTKKDSTGATRTTYQEKFMLQFKAHGSADEIA